MLKLINGEIYRFLHKKSVYAYFGALAVGYILFAFVRSGGLHEESVVNDAIKFFSFSPALIGGLLFSTIYTDDLNAKNLITLVGYGLSKTKIVLAKFILAALLGAAAFGLLPLFHYAVYAVFDCVASPVQIGTLYAVSLKFLLMTLAFCALSSITVYGLQRATFAVVTYILFAFGVISTLLTAVINVLELNLYEHLLSGVTDRIMAGVIGNAALAPAIAQYAVYVIIAVALSAAAFNKKEMEF